MTAWFFTDASAGRKQPNKIFGVYTCACRAAAGDLGGSDSGGVLSDCDAYHDGDGPDVRFGSVAGRGLGSARLEGLGGRWSKDGDGDGDDDGAETAFRSRKLSDYLIMYGG